MPEADDVVICPICQLQSPDVNKEPRTNGDYSVYNCGRCQNYKISRTAETIIRNQGTKLPLLSAWLRETNEYDEEQPFVTSHELNSFVTLEPDRSDQTNIRRLLRYINSHTEALGQTVLIVEHFDYPIIWGINEIELREYLQYLINEGLVEYADNGSLGDSFAYTVKITIKGRALLDDNDVGVSKHTDTQWPAVNQYLEAAYGSLDTPGNIAKHKNCAHSCREAIVALSDAVYDEAEHGPYTRKPSSYSNALTQLDLFLGVALGGGRRKEERDAAKKTVQLANKFAHATSVEFSQAISCYSMTKAIVEAISATA